MATLSCPKCKSKEDMNIPEGKCQLFYTCKACKQLIQAVNGCCVFCDYGSEPCPKAAEHKG